MRRQRHRRQDRSARASSTHLTINVSSASSPPGPATSLLVNQTLGYARCRRPPRTLPSVRRTRRWRLPPDLRATRHRAGAERPQLRRPWTVSVQATPSSFGDSTVWPCPCETSSMSLPPSTSAESASEVSRAASEVSRASRYHQPGRSLCLPPLRRAGRVRAGPHPGALHGWACAAPVRGRNGGRPTVMTRGKIAPAPELYEQGDLTVGEIAKTLGASRAQVYRHLPPLEAGGQARSV